MTDRTSSSGGEAVRDDAATLRERFSGERVEERVSELADERPLVPHLLNLRVVATALAISAVLTLLVAVLLSPQLAALVLVVAFAAAWIVLARRSYERRRPTTEEA